MNAPPEEAPDPRSLAILAHELRTPLNAIIGYAEAMAGEVFGPLPAAYQEAAVTIGEAARHLLDLVDDMTAPHASENVWRGREDRFDPLEVVREVETLTALERRRVDVELLLDSDGPPGVVTGDRRALRQILLNLVGNSIRHTAQGGRISVRLARTEADLFITVADSGGRAGLPGSGLGLRIVRALCALGGGVLETGEEGGGFRARVRLHAPPAEADPC